MPSRSTHKHDPSIPSPNLEPRVDPYQMQRFLCAKAAMFVEGSLEHRARDLKLETNTPHP